MRSCPTLSMEPVLLNRWLYYNSRFWGVICSLSNIKLWAYPVTSPLTSVFQSASLCPWHTCSKFGILITFEYSVSENNFILLHTELRYKRLKLYTCCDAQRKKSSCSIVWYYIRQALHVFRCLSVTDSKLQPYAESISSQPVQWRTPLDDLLGRYMGRSSYICTCQHSEAV
jgi:hypothetical protein